MADLQLKNFEEITTKCGVSEETKKKLYDKYFKYAKDIVISTTVSIITSKVEEIKIFEDTLVNVHDTMGQYLQTQLRPLMIFPNKDQVNIRIYPNIILDKNTDKNKLVNFSISSATDVLSAFIEEYEGDKLIPARVEKWANIDRITKRLNEYVDMPTARALTRYCNYEAAYKPDQIRDFAANIDIARKPLELIFADKPEEMCAMYNSGPSSCMSPKSQYSEGWNFLTEKNLAPPSFYAYFPYTRGAYIMNHGKIVARAVLWADINFINNPKGIPPYSDMGYPNFNKNLCEKWYYGRIYSDTQEMTNKFIKALQSHSISSLNGLFNCPKDTKFVVPGIKLDSKNYGIPFPYFDNLEGVGTDSGYYGKGFFAEYDTTTKVFTLTYSKASKNNAGIPINGRNGFLKSSDYQELNCDCCKGIIHKNKEAINTDDGLSFCSEYCTTKQGYIWAIQGNGNRLYTKPSDEFIRSDDGLLFTTLKAAKDNGYSLKMDELGIMPEENAPVTCKGYRMQDYYGEWVNSPSPNVKFSTDVIPVDMLIAQRTVEFNAEAELAA